MLGNSFFQLRKLGGERLDQGGVEKSGNGRGAQGAKQTQLLKRNDQLYGIINSSNDKRHHLHEGLCLTNHARSLEQPSPNLVHFKKICIKFPISNKNKRKFTQQMSLDRAEETASERKEVDGNGEIRTQKIDLEVIRCHQVSWGCWSVR